MVTGRIEHHSHRKQITGNQCADFLLLCHAQTLWPQTRNSKISFTRTVLVLLVCFSPVSSALLLKIVVYSMCSLWPEGATVYLLAGSHFLYKSLPSSISDAVSHYLPKTQHPGIRGGGGRRSPLMLVVTKDTTGKNVPDWERMGRQESRSQWIIHQRLLKTQTEGNWKYYVGRGNQISVFCEDVNHLILVKSGLWAEKDFMMSNVIWGRIKRKRLLLCSVSGVAVVTPPVPSPLWSPCI